MASRKRPLPVQDAMFLWGESRDTMFHVASLMPFTPPEGAGTTYLRDLLDEVRAAPVVAPWNLRLTHPYTLRHPLQAWVEDENFDIDYHVRRSALASPGDERELGILVSRLHSHQIDFTRPPWEVHIIEGLEGGRFAVYAKVHHALVDGFTAVKLQSRSLSHDPDERGMSLFFSVPMTRAHRPSPEPASPSLLHQLTTPVAGAARGVGTVAAASTEMAKAVLRLETSRFSDEKVVTSLSAPTTILNGRTGRNRRLATQQYEMERLRALARRSGGTLNDVVMAICGGGLRHFLSEQDALPEKPLIAFMPVNIRAEGDEGGGNKVGASLATMGTDIADPIDRLQAVIASTRQAKGRMKEMNQLSALAWSGYMLAPQATQILAAISGVPNPLPTAFNVVLSNVPGPRKPLYLNGARLEAIYPMSIPIHGVALNITLESYADTLNFGFVGCRDAVPSLQNLAVYTGEALEELERAYADRDAAAQRGRKRAGTSTAPATEAPPEQRATGTTTSKATKPAKAAGSRKPSTATQPEKPAQKAAPKPPTMKPQEPESQAGRRAQADRPSSKSAPARKVAGSRTGGPRHAEGDAPSAEPPPTRAVPPRKKGSASKATRDALGPRPPGKG